MRVWIAFLLGTCLFGQSPDPAFAAVQDTPGLPRVLLLGDSISIGYTIPVRQMLAGKANVHRPASNCGPTINGLANIRSWLSGGGWAVIHVNFGLHDLKVMDGGHRQVELADYERNLRQIYSLLAATGAKVIVATTTRVPDAKQNPPRLTADVPRYNEVATRLAGEFGFAVDNLFEVPAEQRPANVHFTDAGYKALAEAVVKSVLNALP